MLICSDYRWGFNRLNRSARSAIILCWKISLHTTPHQPLKHCHQKSKYHSGAKPCAEMMMVVMIMVVMIMVAMMFMTIVVMMMAVVMMDDVMTMVMSGPEARVAKEMQK